ncbi:hypothetical protein L6R46_04365 [Myxococcota bacterium]|nr:hypothetical protein [Myxococcota bacterium]
MSLWNYTPVKPLNLQGNPDDLGTLSECDGWSLIELVSFSGLPWDAHLDLSRQGNSLPTIKVSVSGVARLCVFATSAKVYGYNTSSQTHNVQAMVASIDAPIKTDNVYVEKLVGTGSAVQVTPPPGTTRLSLTINSADPVHRVGVLVTTTDRFSIVTQVISIDQMPEGGLLIGSVETIEVTIPLGLTACLQWHLAF